MSKIKELLSKTAHRPYDMPAENWLFYQEWNRALFLHWIVPYEDLKLLVPKGLTIDTFQGNCYISLVAFTMENIRPKYLPAVSFISDFEEINVRTYVTYQRKPGVYFLNIEAGKLISTLLSKAISGLPYEKSDIYRNENLHTSKNNTKNFSLYAEFELAEDVQNKTELSKWLTERYCLYIDESDKLYRYEIHHIEWPLKSVKIKKLELDYKIGNIRLNSTPSTPIQYSEGVKVVAWQRNKL